MAAHAAGCRAARNGRESPLSVRSSSYCPYASLLACVCASTVGCYRSHELDRPSPRVDAGPRIDAGSPVEPVCGPSAHFIRVTSRSPDSSAECDAGPFHGYVLDRRRDGTSLRIEVDLCPGAETECRCEVLVEGLTPAVAMAIEQVYERIFDAYFEPHPMSLIVRDTSLCDGPAAWACPVTIDLGTTDLSEPRSPDAVRIAWGPPSCDGPDGCAGLRALHFERDYGERVDRATLLQGEVGGVGATHFANLRSWVECVDSLDELTYAHWIY